MWCRVKECFSLRVKGRVISYTPSSKVIFIADEYVNDYVLRYVIPIKIEPVVDPEPVKVSKRGRPSNGDRSNTDAITRDEQPTERTEREPVYYGTSND